MCWKKKKQQNKHIHSHDDSIWTEQGWKIKTYTMWCNKRQCRLQQSVVYFKLSRVLINEPILSVFVNIEYKQQKNDKSLEWTQSKNISIRTLIASGTNAFGNFLQSSLWCIWRSFFITTVKFIVESGVCWNDDANFSFYLF